MVRRNGIVRKDQGWQSMQVALANLNQAHLTIGVQGDAEPYQKGQSGETTTVAQVAAFNEFGTATIPARSFIRSTVFEKHREWRNLAAKLLRTRKVVALRVLQVVGAKAQSDIRQKIVDIRDPANAPSTVARKGFDNPLVETGHLKASIGYEVRPGPAPGGDGGAV